MPDTSQTAETNLDPTNPYARAAQVNPRLTPEMAGRIAGYGAQETLPQGSPVFGRGTLGLTGTIGPAKVYDVAVVGGGNSAGQAAVFLSRTVAHVRIPVRAPGLAAAMSDYLVQRIASSHGITLHARTEITALAGGNLLREVTWTDRGTGAAETRRAGNVFVMIGAEPDSEWLGGCLDLDAKGFVHTGRDAACQAIHGFLHPIVA